MQLQGGGGGWERQGDTEDAKKGFTVKNARDKDWRWAALQQYRCLYKSEVPCRQCPTSKCVITGRADETLQSEYSDIHSHQKPGGVEISTWTNMHKLSINWHTVCTTVLLYKNKHNTSKMLPQPWSRTCKPCHKCQVIAVYCNILVKLMISLDSHSISTSCSMTLIPAQQLRMSAAVHPLLPLHPQQFSIRVV